MLCDGYRSVSTTAAIYVASIKLYLCGSCLKLYSKLTHPHIFILFYTVYRLYICTSTATLIEQSRNPGSFLGTQKPASHSGETEGNQDKFSLVAGLQVPAPPKVPAQEELRIVFAVLRVSLIS